MRDIGQSLSVAQSLVPAARTASGDGAGVDLANFDGAVIVVAAGAITDGTHTIEVQDSADDSSYAAVADAFLVDADGDGTIEPAIGSTDDNKTYEIGYVGGKRYVRVSVTVAGATTGGVYGAAVVRGNPRKAKV